MANIKSAIKRDRQSLIRRARNRSATSTLRTSIKKLRAAVEENNLDAAKDQLRKTHRLLDLTARKGVIHTNNAARRKSRLSRLVAKLEA